MGKYTIALTWEAQADIRKLVPQLQNRVLDKLGWMGANAELLRHQRLRGEEWGESFKYRIGDYRIIYQLDPETQQLIVLKVGHRRDIYKL